ncbi:MAG: DegT/DnrJ/EryC1/StrS family aminotransferase [Phycisphaeraceae bacterium]|nr:DegT/DnrJ/EryC1/StrS family aminotransferase [Phycisphaeraceae bacterium]MBX3409481.1 DegT/DnrJ/EryC1/StrS family aminotransferase [Phycisphaeraceae bacterium]
MPESEIPLSRPDITDLEETMVLAALRSGRLSIGPMVEQFETLVATRAGCRYGVAVNSGTSGLYLALRALNIGPGDEVITTPFSFVASANCILMAGAKPVFVDIDPVTLNMDPSQVEEAITPRTKGIVAVETFGNPAHMDTYAQIAARYEIPVIEDCCEALGTVYKGRPAGHFGRVGVFGFYPNKQITTGEGGLIVTDDQRLAELCRSMRNQGRPIPSSSATLSALEPPGSAPSTGSWLRHERLGYNFRLAEINAALGVAQMKRLDDILERRQSVAHAYLDRLGGNPHLVMPTILDGTSMSWFVFVVRLAPSYTGEERDRIVRGLRRQDIGSVDYFPCIHLLPFYQEQFGYRPGMYPIAESVSQRTLALPFFNTISTREIDLVCQALEMLIGQENLTRA